MKTARDFTVIGAILDRGQKSERKQYGADLMKAQFEECKIVKYRFYFVINLYFNWKWVDRYIFIHDV